MIARLHGTLVERGADWVVLNVHGVGYRVRVSSPTLRELGVGSDAELRTHLHVGDGVMELYGFGSAAEQRVFELLLRVQNVGPGKALQILSAVPARELAQLVASGDRARLRAVPGVGPKTADRLIVELREAFAGEFPGETDEGRAGPQAEAASALVGLGLKQAQAVDLVRRAANESPAPQSVERLVRDALKLMQAR